MENWKKQLEQIKKEVKNDEVNINREEKLKWIDTHSHYYHSKFKKDKEKLLNDMRKVHYVLLIIIFLSKFK